MANPFIVSIADKIFGIIENYLDPAQYDIVRLKHLKRAANWAEKDFQNTYDLLNWVEVEIELNPEKIKELRRFRKIHDKNVAKHQKWD